VAAEPEHARANAAATARLGALADRLHHVADLATPLGGGWTVAIALWHLAFWDGRQRAALEQLAASGMLPGSDADDVTNVALAPLLAALPAGEAASAAMAAATALDAIVATLTPDALEAVRARGAGHVVARAAHRLEHIEQIERALGS
jgi:hypothetical protein